MEQMTLRVFTKRIAEDGAFRNRVARSVSPGSAGAQLGISRQGVHKGLRTGLLSGVRIVSEEGRDIVLVYQESIDARLEKRTA